jgi:hypothetical protein
MKDMKVNGIKMKNMVKGLISFKMEIDMRGIGKKEIKMVKKHLK